MTMGTKIEFVYEDPKLPVLSDNPVEAVEQLFHNLVDRSFTSAHLYV